MAAMQRDFEVKGLLPPPVLNQPAAQIYVATTSTQLGDKHEMMQ